MKDDEMKLTFLRKTDPGSIWKLHSNTSNWYFSKLLDYIWSSKSRLGGAPASATQFLEGSAWPPASFFSSNSTTFCFISTGWLAADRLWLNIDVPASRATTTTTTCSTLTMGKPRLRSATIRFNQFRKKTFVEERKIRKRKKSSWTSLRRSWSQTTLTFPGSQDASLWTGRWVRMERMLTWRFSIWRPDWPGSFTWRWKHRVKIEHTF